MEEALSMAEQHSLFAECFPSELAGKQMPRPVTKRHPDHTKGGVTLHQQAWLALDSPAGAHLKDRSGLAEPTEKDTVTHPSTR
jgi:hypothetical protein